MEITFLLPGKMNTDFFFLFFFSLTLFKIGKVGYDMHGTGSIKIPTFLSTKMAGECMSLLGN